MNIETSKDATRFLRLVIRYVSYIEKLMARAPKDTTLKEWDRHERAAAECRVSDEVGLSLEQLETIKQWDLRAMVKRAFSLFEVPEDTMGFIRARSRTTIGLEYPADYVVKKRQKLAARLTSVSAERVELRSRRLPTPTLFAREAVLPLMARRGSRTAT